MGFISEFKEFAMKGNVMDMAVGVIIGGAFGKIVSSLVNDVLMPLIGKVTGGVSFTDLFVTLGDGEYKTLAEAQEAGTESQRHLQVPPKRNCSQRVAICLKNKVIPAVWRGLLFSHSIVAGAPLDFFASWGSHLLLPFDRCGWL